MVGLRVAVVGNTGHTSADPLVHHGPCPAQHNITPPCPLPLPSRRVAVDTAEVLQAVSTVHPVRALLLSMRNLTADQVLNLLKSCTASGNSSATGGGEGSSSVSASVSGNGGGVDGARSSGGAGNRPSQLHTLAVAEDWPTRDNTISVAMLEGLAQLLEAGRLPVLRKLVLKQRMGADYEQWRPSFARVVRAGCTVQLLPCAWDAGTIAALKSLRKGMPDPDMLLLGARLVEDVEDAGEEEGVHSG